MKLEKHVLSILESLHDPVIIISKDSTIKYINQAYSNQFNVPAEKLIGRKLCEIEPRARILDVLRDGKPRINDYSYVYSLKKDVYANITPLVEDGEVIGVVTIMKDISEIKKLQEELNKYKRYSSQLEEQLIQQSFSLLESKVPKMKEVVNLARKVAQSDATVMLYGESGVGKEVLAKAIHQASNRTGNPFIPINMASIPDSLLESELFGYEEGSFTGSRKGGKKGLFELANGGTLFLDEVGEMSLNAQAKMLRVIQESVYWKIGGTKLYPLDARIICATNRNLGEMVQNGSFRADLYYRLNVVPIHIPPLRERKEDIPYLVQHILRKLTLKYCKHVTIDHEVYEQFKRYNWPGNVRELVNVLERMVVVCQTTHLTSAEVPSYIRGEAPVVSTSSTVPDRPALESEQPLNDILEQTERYVFEKVLRQSRNRSEAIQKLGISRKAFYTRLKKYGIK
ncbi:PAS domain S-box-containing protein [Caldalkalibacillus uzonensis]|uniref:PAS domain S-box-containing protein n=1 Tax=Caldalkalibacillus uzonensis TaxID=353224 RepID=A0ABU0CR50_9BACI|nr:sigma 54-interacting transcriptional regulator [Caldalkalibacillus uzonensis]MDQ0338891.1 PAS domain S-box-containing protein [Caldalkalibacillus uzonensis]